MDQLPIETSPTIEKDEMEFTCSDEEAKLVSTELRDEKDQVENSLDSTESASSVKIIEFNSDGTIK